MSASQRSQEGHQPPNPGVPGRNPRNDPPWWFTLVLALLLLSLAVLGIIVIYVKTFHWLLH